MVIQPALTQRIWPTCWKRLTLYNLPEVRRVSVETHLILSSRRKRHMLPSTLVHRWCWSLTTMQLKLYQPKPMRLKRHVEYLKYAAIDNSWLAADLAASDLHAPELDPAVMLSRYDVCLRTVADAHVPLVSRTITVRPMTPWHTSELAEGKLALRRPERHWRRSGLTVHRQIYTDLRNTFRKALRKARSQYYRSEFTEAGGNMRRIYTHCLAEMVIGPFLKDSFGLTLVFTKIASAVGAVQ